MNEAQKLLVAIGGTAELVAGHMGHYWADSQTAKKQRQRNGWIGIGPGTYGETLRAHFDSKRVEAKKAKEARKAELHQPPRGVAVYRAA